MCMQPIKSRPVKGLTPSNWANPLTCASDDSLERLLAGECSRISKYLGFRSPDLYHDQIETQYDFNSKTIYLNRSWDRNCSWQLGITSPGVADIEHYACFSLAHELGHRFQHEYVEFEDVDKAPELFEAHADLVAGHLYRDRFRLSSDSARFLVPAASSLQKEVGGGAPDYPPGCIRASVVAAGLLSLGFPATHGALNEPNKFFASSLIRAFELVIGQPRLCETENVKCVGCRGEDLRRLDIRFVGPVFDPEHVGDGAKNLIELYMSVFH